MGPVPMENEGDGRHDDRDEGDAHQVVESQRLRKAGTANGKGTTDQRNGRRRAKAKRPALRPGVVL